MVIFKQTMSKPLNIYIHIPFCKAKCSYCHFFTFANKEDSIPTYFNSLEKEILSKVDSMKDYSIQTVYLGGGTPSIVDSEIITKILELLKKQLEFEIDSEITLEANPESIDRSRLINWHNAGINRLSIGLQAWQNSHLRRMGRLYSIEEFIEKITLVKESSINNFNLDVIFGLPNQTMEEWVETIKNVVRLSPNHISCYSLELDNKSKWGKLNSLGKFNTISQELDRKMYQHATKYLQKSGWERYELSNFAKDNKYSKHNLNFWMGHEYIGFGAGAHSFLNNQRFHNIRNLHQYISNPVNSRVDDAKLDEKDRLFEYLLLRLRLINKSISLNEVQSLFPNEFDSFGSKLAKIKNVGLISEKDNQITLTNQGIDLINRVMELLL